MTSARHLAAFAAELEWQSVPERVRVKVTEHILDTLGVMCAGTATPEHAKVCAALGDGGLTQGATVLGRRAGASPRDAAFANAFAGRIHTFDDTLDAGPLHPGSSIVAAALAAAETSTSSGEAFLAAVLAGYEVAARVTFGLGSAHYGSGFHTTGTCNTFGAAAAAGRLAGLDADGLTSALGLAGGMAAGLRQHQIDGAISNSALNGAHAAMAGVTAASLAAAGLKGPAGIIDGPYGVGAMMSPSPDYGLMVDGLGRQFRFAETAVKAYPTCRFTHGPIHEMIRLRETHGLTPAQIGTIELATFRQSIEVSDRRDVRTRTEALLSHQFTLAVVLHRGTVTLAELQPDVISDPSIAALAQRVTVTHDPALEARYPSAWPHRLTLTMADSRQIVAVSERPPGGADQPIARDALLTKFRDLAIPCLGGTGAEGILAVLERLASLPDLSALTRQLRASPSGAAAGGHAPPRAAE